MESGGKEGREEGVEYLRRDPGSEVRVSREEALERTELVLGKGFGGEEVERSRGGGEGGLEGGREGGKEGGRRHMTDG